MTKRDFYEILGVPRTANSDQIKKAFRSKARHLHPDNMDSGDESAFKELAAAYEVLSDDNKRALYDRYGHDGLAGAAGGFDGVDLGAFADLSEIFSTFFGGGRGGGGRRSTVERGSDLKLELRLEFSEAIFGTERKISIKRLEACTVCTGTGAQSGSQPVRCTTCNGAGQIRQATQTLLGQFMQILTCPNCEGEGTRIEKACTVCKGKAQVRTQRDLEIKIPAGIDHGARLRIPHAGDHGRRNGPPGDVYVLITVNDHAKFVREGQTIHLQQPISFAMAALGGEMIVDTVDGEKPLRVPPGTQTGTILPLKGHGAPQLNSPNLRGDQLVHLIVETPTKLTSEQKRLLEKFADSRGDKLSAPKFKRPDTASSANSKPSPGKSSSIKNPSGKGSSGKADSSLIDKIADVFKPKEGASEN
jgi:molecular chaperone DnaJ